MLKIYDTVHKINAWHVRIVALSLLVLCIGSGSQFLVNAFAAGAQLEQENIQTAINISVDTPPVVVPFSRHGHIIIHRAGADSLGGYTITSKK